MQKFIIKKKNGATKKKAGVGRDSYIANADKCKKRGIPSIREELVFRSSLSLVAKWIHT